MPEHLAVDVAVVQDGDCEVSSLFRAADSAGGCGLRQLPRIIGKHRGLGEAWRKDVDGDAVSGHAAAQEVRETGEAALEEA
jgi:hypothetical protein